jgi:aldehyde:ferredoxin oxidoreductase
MSEYCFAGKSLFVDLSARSIDTKRTKEIESGFLGGRGLNQSILLDQQKDGTQPFDEDNTIIFGSGRLVGTGTPSAVRLNIDSKNVFTGGIGSSNVGGKFATELKNAGFDHIVISGKSKRPVFLWVSNDGAEIRDAGQLWGKMVFETGQLLRESLRDKEIQYIAIGPAGEHLVWAAAIIEGNSRGAGRCGLGAIMGDKKLKAIAVRGAGRGLIQIAQPDRFSKLAKQFSDKLSSLPAVLKKRQFGTIAAVNEANRMMQPVHNYADEWLSEEEIRSYSADKFEKMAIGRVSYPCPIECHHMYRGSSPNEIPLDKLEANTVWDFGPRLGLTNAEDLLTCHALCTHYGLDIDTTGAVISWAMDCFEKGLLELSDTDGVSLRWGDAKTVFQLIKKIALREGIGDLLSQGSQKASLVIGKGSEKLSVNIKGMDLIEAIRSLKGWALGVVVSPRGGTHTRGAPQTENYRMDRDISKKIFGVETAGIPEEYEGKPNVVFYYEKLHAVLDSLGLCHFASNWSAPGQGTPGPDEIAAILTAAVGEDFSGDNLMERGEKILSLEKIYNLIHTNFGRKDDYPPERLMKEPIKTGPFKGAKLDRNEWDTMLSEYYSLHGWDPNSGFPKEETLRKLGLGKYTNILKNKGKIV